MILTLDTTLTSVQTSSHLITDATSTRTTIATILETGSITETAPTTVESWDTILESLTSTTTIQVRSS